jgi:hypothetical protein
MQDTSIKSEESDNKSEKSDEESDKSDNKADGKLDSIKNKSTTTTISTVSNTMSDRMPFEKFMYSGDHSTVGSEWETWLERFKLRADASVIIDN